MLACLLVVVLTAAGLIAVPATDASADIFGPDSCKGFEVRRCIRLEYDPATHRVRADAWIEDRDGGRSYYVAVNRIQLQVPFFGAWASADTILGANTLRGDHDGWWAWDHAESGSLGCRRVTVRGHARFSWRRWGSSAVTRGARATAPLNLGFCD
jgi:hypothetical protein